MARSRMIRPEFWDDEKLSRVSIPARLIFIGMWTHSDDYGNVKGNPRWLRNHILPYEDSLSPHGFLIHLDELEQINCIRKYEHKNEVFYHVENFLKHQKVNRPSQQRNPAPIDNVFSEGSMRTHGGLNEDSLTKQKQKQKQKQNKKIHDETKPEKKEFTPNKKDFSGLKSGTFKPKKTTKKTGFKFENMTGVFKDIKSKCDELITLQIKKPKQNFFNPKLWVQAQLKTQKHPEAILKSLLGLELYWDDVKAPWGYCDNILSKVDGNFNEQEAIKIHNDIKGLTIPELTELTQGLFEGMEK